MSHIIWKELLRSKKYMTLLYIIVTFMFFIVGVLVINHNRDMAGFVGPDIEIYGTLVMDENPYAYCSPLNVEQWEVLNHEQVDVYYMIIRNLVELTDNTTLARVGFYLLGCPVDFINNRLSEYIVEGRVPELGRHEVMMGENMARLYGLSVGSVFDHSLVSTSAYQDDGIVGIAISVEEDAREDEAQWTVTGIISSHQKQLDCSLFLPVEEEKISDLSNKVNIYLNGKVTGKEYLQIKDEILESMGEVRGYLYQYYYERIKKQNEARFIIFSVAVSMLVITYILMIYIFKSDARKIGILNALGLKNGTITKYYLSLFSIICLLGFVTSIILITLYNIYKNSSLVVILGVSETAYALDLKTCLILISGGILFLLLLGVIVSVKVYRCRIMYSVAQK